MPALDDAVAIWKAIDYSGTGDWIDSTGNSHDLTSNGAVWTVDHWLLNGVDQDLFAANHADLDASTTGFTAAVLGHAVGAGGTDAVMAKKVDQGVGTVGWTMHLFPGTPSVRGLWSDGVTRTVGTGLATSLNTKVLWVLRRNATNMVVNSDTNEQEDLDLSNADMSNALTLRVGSHNDATDYYEGRIYAAAVWQREITDAEIVGLEAELETPTPTGTRRIMRSPRYGITRMARR